MTAHDRPQHEDARITVPDVPAWTVRRPRITGHRQPGHDRHPAALTALAWVRLERHERREARRCVRQAGTALDRTPDELIAAAACLVAAGGALAGGRGSVAAQVITRARPGRPIPPWPGRQLSMIQSRACAAAGDIPAALAAAGRAGSEDPPEAAVTLAHARAAAGDSGISPVPRQDPGLAGAHRRLLPAPGHAQPAPATGPDQDPVLPAVPLSGREREVLRHISGMLSTAEVASEMHISASTVKTHPRAIRRKLAAAHRGEAARRARQPEADLITARRGKQEEQP